MDSSLDERGFDRLFGASFRAGTRVPYRRDGASTVANPAIRETERAPVRSRMRYPPSLMRFLLTNDDGHDAPGLAALERAVGAIGEVFVAAPAREWSGCGHRVTTHEPIKVEAVGERRFVVHGTPADCVRIGLDKLVP